MKTTKNKIIKGIKVLSNGPLYCATFISVGCDLFGGKKDMTPITDIPSKPSAPYSAYCKIDENEPLNEGGVDNPGFKGSAGSSDNSTDENNNLVESPNVEEGRAKQNKEANIPKDPKKSSSKVKETSVPVKNDTLILTPNQKNKKVDSKSQNTAPNTPKNNNNGNQNTITPNPGSGDHPSKNTKHKDNKLEDTTKQGTPLDEYLNSLLVNLESKRKQLKDLPGKKGKKDKKEQKIKEFLEENSSSKIKKIMENQSSSNEDKKAYLEGILKLADSYIKEYSKKK